MTGFTLDDLNYKKITSEKVLGTVTYWTVLQGTYDYGKVIEALEKNGLSKNLLIEPTIKKAFTRSCRSFVKGHKDKFDRKIVDDESKLIVGIVHETKDKEHERLKYRHSTTAKLHKGVGSVEVEGAEKDEFMEQYNHFSGHITHEDIQRMLRRLISRCHGISLRETGGIYFVPEKAIPEMIQVDSVLKEITAGKIYLLRVPNGEQEKQVTWERVTTHVEETIKDILVKVETVEKRASCLSHHEDRLKEVQKMLNYYAELTESEAMLEELREQISETANVIAGRASFFQEKMLKKHEEKKVGTGERKKVREEKKAEKEAFREVKRKIREEKKAAKEAAKEARMMEKMEKKAAVEARKKAREEKKATVKV